MKKPEIGDKIYVPTALHVYRGLDDFAGGLATINRIEASDHLPVDHVNHLKVGVKENPTVMYYWHFLSEKQERMAIDYAGRIANPDPDDRPEFNDENEGWH